MTLVYGRETAGQRTGPRVASENYWFRRHVAAYRFARPRVAGLVIDLGAGEGYGAALLARRLRLVGLDLDEAAVRHASARYPRVSFLRADLCRTPVAERSVDALVALQVLEHLHCPAEFVDACRRSLRPGGVLVASTPNRSTFPEGNPSHVHEYDARELRGLLASAFDRPWIGGIRHAPPLAALDRVLGEPLQHRLVRGAYEDQPAWLRALLRTVTSRDFRLTGGTDGCLDLFAVAAVP
jgi:SAM-dependent methyltransferase